MNPYNATNLSFSSTVLANQSSTGLFFLTEKSYNKRRRKMIGVVLKGHDYKYERKWTYKIIYFWFLDLSM